MQPQLALQCSKVVLCVSNHEKIVSLLSLAEEVVHTYNKTIVRSGRHIHTTLSTPSFTSLQTHCCNTLNATHWLHHSLQEINNITDRQLRVHFCYVPYQRLKHKLQPYCYLPCLANKASVLCPTLMQISSSHICIFSKSHTKVLEVYSAHINTTFECFKNVYQKKQTPLQICLVCVWVL